MTCPFCGGQTVPVYKANWCESCRKTDFGVNITCVGADMTDDLRGSLMLNKKAYEARGEDLRSGALELNLRGPREFHPQLDKKFY